MVIEMRDLLFRNLTSKKKQRRCLSMYEVVKQDGILAKTHRHAVYSFEKVPNANQELEKPTLNVIRLHDSKTKKDKVFCKMKGKVFAFCNKTIYLVSFVHTLRIELSENCRC